MKVCNISFQIESSIVPIWIAWMQEQFIQSFMATDCFIDSRFYQLEVDTTQSPTFTLQLFAKSAESMELYKSKHAADLIMTLHNVWGEQCFHFSSFMQIVN